MFDDFHSSPNQRQARRRFGGSFAVAVVLYGSSSAAIIGATATVRQAVEEEEGQVEFAPAPEPEPPPPPPPPVQEAPPPPSARPKVRRPEMATPEEIPEEKPAESDAPLAAAGESGPVDGFLDGVNGGTGNAAAPPPIATAAPPPPPPPPPRLEPLVPPVARPGNAIPRYPARARRKGVEGVVVVSFEILEDGRVVNPRIVSGPVELHETVLETVVTWRYQPARRGPTAERYRTQKPIRFRLEDE